MKRSLQTNPRLIPLDVPAIQEMSEKYVGVIAAEAREMLRKYPRTGDTPIGMMDLSFPLVEVTIENKNRGARARTLTVSILTEVLKLTPQQKQWVLDGELLACKSIIPGAAIAQTFHRARRDMLIKWCGALTLEELSRADNVFSGVSGTVRDVMLHEMTHASEHSGIVMDYPLASPGLPLGKDPRYYNHPIELRAYARQVAMETERKYRAKRRMKKTAAYTGENLEADILQTIEQTKTYQQVKHYLSDSNHKKLMQLVVRHLEEKDLFEKTN